MTSLLVELAEFPLIDLSDPMILEKSFQKISNSQCCLEIGCGKGRFLRDVAIRNPQKFYVGLETKKDRARRSALKCLKAGLENVFVIASSLEDLFQILDPSILFEEIYLNFPDPWPKKRHATRRLLSIEKVELYKKWLRKKGQLVFVTDDPCYAFEGAEHLKQQDFVDVFGGPRHHWPCYPVTIHEEKFRRQGREIYYQKFCKK